MIWRMQVLAARAANPAGPAYIYARKSIRPTRELAQNSCTTMPLLRTPLLPPGAGSSRQSCAIIGTSSVAGAAAGGLAPWHSGGVHGGAIQHFVVCAIF